MRNVYEIQLSLRNINVLPNSSHLQFLITVNRSGRSYFLRHSRAWCQTHIFPPLAFARARISLTTGTGYVSVVGSVGLLDYVSFIFTNQTLPHLWFLKVTSLNSVVKLTQLNKLSYLNSNT